MRTAISLEAIRDANLNAHQTFMAQIIAVVRNRLINEDLRLEEMTDADIVALVTRNGAAS
jgi:hypothetical protein